MKHFEKGQAVILRKKGYSYNEIVRKLKVAKSSVSLWVRGIDLPPRALARIESLQTAGQKAAKLSKLRKTQENLQRARETADELVGRILVTRDLAIISCALLYWCEGAKTLNDSSTTFSNSDPQVIGAFITLMREAFNLDERKFRIRMHLHEYHNELNQQRFWSRVTGLPSRQFHQVYRKPNTGKNIKPGYPGCVHIYYYDVKIARTLCATARAFLGAVIK